MMGSNRSSDEKPCKNPSPRRTLDEYRINGAIRAREQAPEEGLPPLRKLLPRLGKILGISIGVLLGLPIAILFTLVVLSIGIMAFTTTSSTSTVESYLCKPVPDSLVVHNSACDSWLTDITVHLSFSCSTTDVNRILKSKPYEQTDRSLSSSSSSVKWWPDDTGLYTHYQITRKQSEEHLWISQDQTNCYFYYFGY